MASAPEDSGTTELQQLKPGDDDYDPFTDEDIQKILHEEQTNSAEEGWSFVKRTNLSEIWRKNERDKPVHLIKGYLNFPGVPPEKVVEMIHNLEVRKEWDEQFPIIDVLEHHKNYRVVYWLVKMPIGVANRDVVQYISQRRDESTNTTYILYRNTTHPDRPERKGIVRAETILSGLIIRPDPEDSNSCKMSILLQNDIKGWVPHFIVNAFAARAPEGWRNSLANYYLNVYSKRGEGEGEEGAPAQQGQSSEEGGDKGQDAGADAEGGGDKDAETESGGQSASAKDEEKSAEAEGQSSETAGGEQGEALPETESKEDNSAEPPASS